MLTFSRRLFSLNFLEGAGLNSFIHRFMYDFSGGGSRGRGDGDRGGAGGEGGLLILNNFFIFKYFFSFYSRAPYVSDL